MVFSWQFDCIMAYKAHGLDRSKQNSPLRLMEDPNIELLGSWGRPITLYWLPAPGIPVNNSMFIDNNNKAETKNYKCWSSPAGL